TRGEMNGTSPGGQEGAGSGSGRSCGESPVGRGRRVPRADGRTDDRAARQGEKAGRVHACGQEHAGTQGARRHLVRSRGTEAQGASGARFLERRSGRGRARGEGLRQGARQAGGDACVSRWAGTARRGARESSESADPRTGAVDAARRAEGADPEVRAHARRAAGETRPHRCRHTRPETGRGRLIVWNIFRRLTWLSIKTKSSMQSPG